MYEMHMTTLTSAESTVANFQLRNAFYRNFTGFRTIDLGL